MRQGNVAAGRSQEIDRAPTITDFNYTSNLVPGALTTRWTYTVPAARKARIGYIFQTSFRDIAPAPTGLVSIIASRVTGGGSVAGAISFNDATLNVWRWFYVGAGAFLVAADQMHLQTQDSSTGGQTEVMGGAYFNEFDA